MSAKKSGALNPMYNKPKSIEFQAMMDGQWGDKNPMCKATYVWDIANKIQLGPFPSKSILTMFHVGPKAYYRALQTGLPHNGYYYSREPFVQTFVQPFVQPFVHNDVHNDKKSS